MQAQFQIGQRVKAVAFVDCFGKQVEETPNLTVESMKLITSDVAMDILKPYYRVLARAESGFGYIEGAERFFEAS